MSAMPAIRPVAPVRVRHVGEYPRAALATIPGEAVRPHTVPPLRKAGVDSAAPAQPGMGAPIDAAGGVSPGPLDAMWAEYQGLSWNGSEASQRTKAELLDAIGALRDGRAIAPLGREYRSLSWNGSQRTVEIKQKLLAALGQLGGDEAASVLLPEYQNLSWNVNAGVKRQVLATLAMTGSDLVADALTAEYRQISWNSYSENVQRKRLLLETIKATRAAADR